MCLSASRKRAGAAVRVGQLHLEGVRARLLNAALCRSEAGRPVSQTDATFDFNHLKYAQNDALYTAVV